jgi:Flp pilus assembly protein TadG
VRRGVNGSDERGAVAIVVAAATVALFGLLAIVVDLGMARDGHQLAQNAADAAALGAASSLARAVNPAAVTSQEVAQARAVADAYTQANGWEAGIATFTVDPAATTVRIALTPAQSPAIFAAAIGAGTPTVGASAQATCRNAPAPCTLCVLGDFSAQNGQTVGAAGNVLIRGNLTVAPNGTMTSTTGIVGYGGSLSNSGTITPAPVQITPITDPYAVTPLLPPGPPAPALGTAVSTASGGQCQPGTYDDITACRTFAPGVYVITGQNRFRGNINVTSNGGVLLYLTCSATAAGTTVSAACQPGDQGGSLDFGGVVHANLTAMTDPSYRGLAIIYDRNNTSPLAIVGGPNITINGGVYAASATLRNNGTGPLLVNGTMVVGGVDLRGVPATVTITQSNAFADLPPMLIHLSQ